MTSETAGPRTPAGHCSACDGHGVDEPFDCREAVTLALTELRREVEGLPDFMTKDGSSWPWVSRLRLYDAIDKALIDKAVPR